MTLQGWSLPLSPGGTRVARPAAAVALLRRRRSVSTSAADPAAMAAVLPPAMSRSATGRRRSSSSTGRRRPTPIRASSADPARGQYKEAYVEVHATLDGAKVARVPYIWVDNDLSFARGHIQGFPKKLGTIAITKPVTVGRGGPQTRSRARPSPATSPAWGANWPAARSRSKHRRRPGFVPRALRLPIWHTRLRARSRRRRAARPRPGPQPGHRLRGRRRVARARQLEFSESDFEELAALATARDHRRLPLRDRVHHHRRRSPAGCSTSWRPRGDVR